jgi:hypothetical protein
MGGILVHEFTARALLADGLVDELHVFASRSRVVLELGSSPRVRSR